VTFQEYLVSKKIDAKAFSAAEPAVFNVWEREFEQMHPNSFTIQKLNLINPIRRKYQLPLDQQPPVSPALVPNSPNPESATQSTASAPKVPRPMMKPKPKIT
jgi:hypothetical protein